MGSLCGYQLFDSMEQMPVFDKVFFCVTPTKVSGDAAPSPFHKSEPLKL